MEPATDAIVAVQPHVACWRAPADAEDSRAKSSDAPAVLEPTRRPSGGTRVSHDEPGGLPSLQPLLVGALIVTCVWLLSAYAMQVARIPSGAHAVSLLWSYCIGFVVFAVVMLLVLLKCIGEVKAIVDGALWLREYLLKHYRASNEPADAEGAGSVTAPLLV